MSAPWALLVALLGLTAVLPAHARTAPPPPSPPYPESEALPVVAEWIRTKTGLNVESIVAIGEGAAFAVEPVTGSNSLFQRTRIHQEALSAQTAQQLGGRSAVMTADVDCAQARVFQRGLDVYAGSNARGAVQKLGAGSDWETIPPGTFMDDVMAAVCDPAYRPLFSLPSTTVAVASPPAPPAALPVQAPEPPARAAPATTASIDTPAPVIAPVPPAVETITPAPAPASAEAKPIEMASMAAPPPVKATTAHPPRVIGKLTPAPVQAPAAATTPPPSQPQLRADLGMFETMDSAIAAWRELVAITPQPAQRRQRVNIAVVDGRAVFHGYVEGFADQAEVEAFCAMAQPAGHACKVM